MGFSESTSLSNQTASDPSRRTKYNTPGGIMPQTGLQDTRHLLTRGMNREEKTAFTQANFSGPFGPTGTGAPSRVPGGGNAARGNTVAGGPENLPSSNTRGSQSGPGILESWFNQRATGTDPAYEYSLKRGGDEIDTRMSAGGSFNSGARGLQLSDMAANMGARRMGQLDALAGGASGEHLGRLGLMFNQGLGLANGESGLTTAYDLGAAGNMSAAAEAQRMMAMNQAGVDGQGNQAAFNNVSSIWGMGGNKK